MKKFDSGFATTHGSHVVVNEESNLKSFSSSSGMVVSLLFPSAFFSPLFIVIAHGWVI